MERRLAPKGDSRWIRGALNKTLTLVSEREGVASNALVGLPLVTIVITNFNYRDYVGEAIRSALAQTYPNLEIVVVDDVSTDDSAEVIAKCLGGRRNTTLFRRVYNGGQGAAMLDGLRNSEGEFICFLDADDGLASRILRDACLSSSRTATTGRIHLHGLGSHYQARPGLQRQFW